MPLIFGYASSPQDRVQYYLATFGSAFGFVLFEWYIKQGDRTGCDGISGCAADRGCCLDAQVESRTCWSKTRRCMMTWCGRF